MADVCLQHFIDKMEKLLSANVFSRRYIQFVEAVVQQFLNLA